MVEFVYTVKEATGIHARPAGQLVKEAAKYTDKITLFCGEKSADMKRLFAVLGLGAGQGKTVRVCVEGAGEADTAAQLKKYFEENL